MMATATVRQGSLLRGHRGGHPGGHHRGDPPPGNDDFREIARNIARKFLFVKVV